MSNPCESNPYELVTAISAVVIALIALITSIYQGIATRRHNILLVRPKLHFITNMIGPGENFQLKLTNAGIGPAIIKKMTASFDGDQLPEDDPLLHFMGRIGIHEIVGGGDCGIFRSHYPKGDFTILPGEKIILMEIGREDRLAQDEIDIIRKKLIPKLNKLNIEIEYQSMYGDKDSTFKESLALD